MQIDYFSADARRRLITKKWRFIFRIAVVQWFLTGVRRSFFKGSEDVFRYFDVLSKNF